MNRVVLQVPMTNILRKDAQEEAKRQGFSSLQDAVRMFLNKLAMRKIDVSFKEEDVVYLSPRAERRYNKMSDDIKSGKEKIFTAKNVEELMNQLNK